MAAGMEPLVAFWSAWGIQIVMLLSFAVQVTLLLLADFRRRTDWPVLKIIIWSAYMLADTAAIYALGHLSVVVRSHEHRLMALWAPLLLVHLGGQDNISAYAIEDNRLWVRHLQTFGLQVLAASYVIYASSILSSFLSPALCESTLSLYVAGVLKYGERVWTLMCADRSASSCLSATCYKNFGTDQANDARQALSVGAATPQTDQVDFGTDQANNGGQGHQALSIEVATSQTNQVDFGTERDVDALSANTTTRQRDEHSYEVLSAAYELLDAPKQMFQGPTRFVKIERSWHCEGDFMLQVVEMQLTMMYDLLYTKAAVVHTWYGFWVRFFTLPFTFYATIIMFQSFSMSDKHGYTRADVFVTKVLLTGALVMETMSVLKAVFSMWTAALLYEEDSEKLGFVVQYVELVFVIWPMMLLALRKGYWSGRMGQHGLFKLMSHSHRSMGSKIARKMGLEDLWDSTIYSWSTRVPRVINDKVLELVSAPTEDGQIDITKSRGQNTLRRRSYEDDLAWSVEFDLDESILVWHIATHVYLTWYDRKAQQATPPVIKRMPDLRKGIDALCNYMFFLLAARPYMLPYPVTRQRYVQLCHDSITHLSSCSSASDLLSAIVYQKEALMEGSPLAERYLLSPSISINSTLYRGCRLAAKLLHAAEGADAAEKGMDAGGVLEMIFEVWVEMLCYTAYWCDEKSHAKNLTNGGELMTIVALMMVYALNGVI